jgi:hypothetical protein
MLGTEVVNRVSLDLNGISCVRLSNQ